MAKRRKANQAGPCLLSPRKLRLELQRLATSVEIHELSAQRLVQLPEPLLVALVNLLSDVQTELRIDREAERKKQEQGAVDDW